ncbi:MAG: MoxR family ATPase [Anaerolineae bacterium]|nr:MoxR family ATPase [Anaerolineae bacterium]MCO5191485.1 MoxR family ATPase [Anaerolineae bacterium]MCO5193756.1 MoxR family ATPase [Anaerolineae bacterium]MCO5205173.1 MoxR family ATPase [Anaerolineae bacterium]
MKQVAVISNKVIAEVEKAIIGKHDLIRTVMTAILADGHILLEDFPGLGKTLLANTFATALGIKFKRIQFTPDLLPGDITGGYIFNRASSQFELRKGPLFANIVLADEINRASPKTQSALLEAMQEHQVTLEGETMRLPQPFIVMATQNPIEYEGTFPLPEAQLDRFMIKVSVGYPSAEEEQEILRRRQARRQERVDLNAVTTAAELQQLRDAVETVFVDPDMQKYMVDLVTATRRDSRVAVGASPRGSLALLKLARAWAALDGREYVLPDDIKTFAHPALMHRIILEPDLWMKRNAARDVINTITKTVPVPVIEGA